MGYIILLIAFVALAIVWKITKGIVKIILFLLIVFIASGIFFGTSAVERSAPPAPSTSLL